MNKYLGVGLLLVAEAAFFALFRDHYGKRFVKFLPIIFLAELYYVQGFAKAFVSIKKFCPDCIAAARVRYMPVALGLLAIVAIAVGIVGTDFIFPVGIAAVAISAWGKVLVYRHIDRTGVVT